MFVFLAFGAVAGAIPVDPCKTPDGLNGDCKLVNECEPLRQRLYQKPLSLNDISFLRNSTCGFVGALPKGCCPIGSPNNENSEGLIPDPFSTNFEAVTSTLLPSTDECGLYNPYRTFGREHPDLYEFPWIALLEYNISDSRRKFMCGGALISTRYVLTAAHCIEVAKNRKQHLINVRLGEYNIDTDPDCVDYGFGEECAEPSINIEVEKVVVHEGFERTGFEHNIALVRLKKEVEFSDFVQPLCLPMTSQELTRNYVGKKLFLGGWRDTDSKIKLKDQILVQKSNDCITRFPEYANVSEYHLCASGEGGKMSCVNDGGGPLMAIGTDKKRKITRWYAIGVSSFGMPRSCSFEGYTRVSKYVQWIVNKLEP